MASSGMHTYSELAPLENNISPKTSSLIDNLVTSSPIASITPEKPVPNAVFFGLRIPKNNLANFGTP